MLLAQLLLNPLLFVIIAIGIVLAITIHEFSHAYAAARLGDETALRYGRVTLNPLKHLTLMGTLMLLIAGFGWGRPVPVNPLNLKHGRWGSAIVSIAGPGSNLILAIVLMILLKILLVFNIVPVNNLLPVFLSYIIFINIILLVFNLIPIPPLDGSKVLYAFLKDHKFDDFKLQLQQYGPLILIALILLDNFLPFSIFGLLYGWILLLINKFVPIIDILNIVLAG